MKKLRIIQIMLLMVLGAGANAQQIPQHSQFMFNDFLVNPAITGTKDYFQAISNNRYQWIGVVDAPRTYVLSVYGPHRSKNMGFGGYIFNDVTGPTTRSGINLSYGYQFQLTSDIKLSLGLAAGLLQYKIDATKIDFHDPEVVIGDNMYTDYLPDGNAGVYMYGSNYFFGIAGNQLFNNRVKLDGSRSDSQMQLKTHLNVIGGYRFPISDAFAIEPSVQLKYILSTSIYQAELNARFIYDEDIWAGISYRHDDAVSVLVGYEILDQIFIGYSYDISTTKLIDYSTGTHELMIGAKFNKLKQDSE